MIKIDGVTYNVPVLRLKRGAAVLDKYAERTTDGVLHREIIGVYFNYYLDFGSIVGSVDYNALWNKLTEPVEFHVIEIPDETGTFTFTAYISSVEDEFKRVEGTDIRYMKSLKANFIAKMPARTP